MPRKKLKPNSKKKPLKVYNPMAKIEIGVVGGEKKIKNTIDKPKSSKRLDSWGRDISKVDKKTAKNKLKILVGLTKTFGIVTNAIAKVGIDNSTFYKWFKDDKEFAEEVEKIQDSFDVIVEDKLKQKIIQNDGHSIRFYLSHRVAKYRPKVGFGQDDDAKPIQMMITTYDPNDPEGLND
jgi:hypothetical protein